MKKTVIFSVLVGLIIITTSAIQNTTNDCDVRTLKNELIRGLRPDFKYDSFKATRFVYKNQVQVLEIAAPLFKDEKFRFLINTAGLPKGIEVKFFDKKKGSKNRKQLFSSADAKEKSKTVYVFDPQVSKKIYLNYIIPRTTKQNLSGCVVCVIGYNLN
ncbi:MAG: hypothetical protein COA97_01420 [Flavobacteriales bacterium]|nr:MAG: hypothetical protein COA97_01420 [Flavobacteriales bacterium]